MGLMDKLKGLVGGNKKQVDKGIDTAADKAQDMSGHKADAPDRRRRPTRPRTSSTSSTLEALR